MLPIESQHRLINSLPDAYRLRVDGTLYEQDIHKWWAHEDRDIEFPAVELELGPVGNRREGEQPLDQIIKRLAVEEDETVAYNRLKGERVFDEARVRVACQGQELGVSASTRARILIRQVSQRIRFGLDHLNHPGEGYNEIPMLVSMTDPAEDTSDLIDESQTSQWEFGIRINYTLTQDLLVDAVAEIDIEYVHHH